MRWFVSYRAYLYTSSVESTNVWNCIVEWDGIDLTDLYKLVQSVIPEQMPLKEVVGITLIPDDFTESSILKCENEALKLMNAKLQELLLEHGITYESRT